MISQRNNDGFDDEGKIGEPRSPRQALVCHATRGAELGDIAFLDVRHRWYRTVCGLHVLGNHSTDAAEGLSPSRTGVSNRRVRFRLPMGPGGGLDVLARDATPRPRSGHSSQVDAQLPSQLAHRGHGLYPAVSGVATGGALNLSVRCRRLDPFARGTAAFTDGDQ